MLLQRVVLLFLLQCSFFMLSAQDIHKKKSDFVVRKKKKKGLSLGKSKEKACRAFGDCIQSGAQAIKVVAEVQTDMLEKTVAHLQGDNSFVHLNKAQIQKLTAKAEQLQKKMDDLAAQCNDFLKRSLG